jgi:hypothetical protein
VNRPSVFPHGPHHLIRIRLRCGLPDRAAPKADAQARLFLTTNNRTTFDGVIALVAR